MSVKSHGGNPSRLALQRVIAGKTQACGQRDSQELEKAVRSKGKLQIAVGAGGSRAGPWQRSAQPRARRPAGQLIACARLGRGCAAFWHRNRV